jgi:hypothetical protein
MLRRLALLVALLTACHFTALAGTDWSEGDTIHVISGKITTPFASIIDEEGTLLPDPWPWFEVHILRYNSEGVLLERTATWYRDVYENGKKNGEKVKYSWSTFAMTVSRITAKGEAFLYVWDYPCFGKFKNSRLQSATGLYTDDDFSNGGEGSIYTYKSSYRANSSLAKAIMKAMQGEGATWPTTAQDLVDEMLEKKGYIED